MSKKGTRIDTLTLKPSESAIAIKHMVKVNLENAKQGKKRRGLFLWGAPGIAKSSVVEQVAKQLNFKLIDIRLTQMEPTDLRGIPVPFKDDAGRAYVEWAVPMLLPKRDAGERTSTIVDEFGHKYDGAIILLDELPNAAPSVQAGSYQIVLDGALGEWTCPDNVIVMAAGNRDTDKGSTFKMPTPLMNRFTHIEMTVDFMDFQTYALQSGFHKAVVGYLTAFKHELFQFEPTSASRGFPTPRSWESVSDILRGDPNLPEMVQLALISGAVGDGVAVKFLEYRKNAEAMPAAIDILDGKVKELKRTDVSLCYALTTAMCYELRDSANRVSKASKENTKKEKDTLNKHIDNFLGFMMKNFQTEMVVMGARTAMAVFKIPIEAKALTNWSDFSDRYQELILSS